MSFKVYDSKANNARTKEAYRIRKNAAKTAHKRSHKAHQANGDENAGERYYANFTKGLAHDYDTGLVLEKADYEEFVNAIDPNSGDKVSHFKNVPLGPQGYCDNGNSEEPWRSDSEKQKNEVRAWESQSAGNAFDLQGPDAQSVTMPPAPEMSSSHLRDEIVEVYAQALLRDRPFEEIDAILNDPNHQQNNVYQNINDATVKSQYDCIKLFIDQLKIRRVKQYKQGYKLDSESYRPFRGITPGDQVGPYLSQFLLVGSPLISDPSSFAGGCIRYGATRIDQRVRQARSGKDYLNSWNEWFDVQQGANLRDTEEEYKDANNPLAYRFITTPRDLATYVHHDQLYQAYLNACLILLSDGSCNIDKFDKGIPFIDDDDCEDHQQGFALFGGPHILTLVTEVATRALKAVRFQKFNVHRRLRPEALAARLHKAGVLSGSGIQVPESMLKKINSDDGLGKCILEAIAKKNKADNLADNQTGEDEPNYLLPMAFPEGSPMHPSYGAGHATVAGACVTILKAFFNHERKLKYANGDEQKAFVPNVSQGKAKLIEKESPALTVEGELNKLASNISIGRNWAGVHYFSDYIESLRLGEEIAIGLLEEQMFTYKESFSMTIPLFNGREQVVLSSNPPTRTLGPRPL